MKMLSFRSVLLFACACSSYCAGCADAAGRFRQFEDRRAALGDALGMAGASGAGAGEDCRPPSPNVVQGLALLALETSGGPGAPILFFGVVETPELDGQTAVKYSYKALNTHDRHTEVGDPLLVGPYPIGEDGTFDAPTEEATLPGEADAILPGVPIVSQLTLHGTICGVSEFYCGTVTGNVKSPFSGPTQGQFGLQLVKSLNDLPARPRYGCSEDALAPELP
ncbi:MAG TPA: hypothetical protein VHB79_17050 [Polyangiaceae bacterium]|nr:hypothetical protein [Polyangiaceae bacterium]